MNMTKDSVTVVKAIYRDASFEGAFVADDDSLGKLLDWFDTNVAADPRNRDDPVERAYGSVLWVFKKLLRDGNLDETSQDMIRTTLVWLACRCEDGAEVQPIAARGGHTLLFEFSDDGFELNIFPSEDDPAASVPAGATRH